MTLQLLVVVWPFVDVMHETCPFWTFDTPSVCRINAATDEVCSLKSFIFLSPRETRTKNKTDLPFIGWSFVDWFLRYHSCWFITYQIVNPHNKDIRDIPGLAPPAPTRKLLWYANWSVSAELSYTLIEYFGGTGSGAPGYTTKDSINVLDDLNP